MAERRLSVYLDGRHVGTLWSEGPGLRFAYVEAVFGDRSAAVSVRLPVRSEPFDDHLVRPCFENLLPEGDLRGYLAKSEKVDESDILGLLAAFAGECAGALALWPEGERPPDHARYAPCTVADVRAALAMVRQQEANYRSESTTAAVLKRGRLSLSGAQDKVPLFRRPPTGPGPVYQLPLNGAPSTVLLKHARAERFPGLLHNELACMRLMAAAGVPTAESTVYAHDRAVYETARFDRVLHDDARVQRLHAEDGCQVAGVPSRQKYASTGGPTFSTLVTVLSRWGAAPAEDAEILFRWAVANLALGNRDAHAKNVTLLHTAAGVRLAPAYDVTCTLAYPELDAAELPLRFGGQGTVGALTPHSLIVASREFRVTRDRARTLTEAVCASLAAGVPAALHEVAQLAGDDPVLGWLERALPESIAGARTHLLG